MKHRFARRVQRTLALTLTLCIAFQSLLSVFAPSPVARAATAAAIDAGPVRVRYYYASDDATAQAVQELLAGAGFTVETVRLGAPPQQNFSLHLPIITRGGGAAATTRASAATGLDATDLVVIGADTGAGGTWNPQAGLFEQIRDAGLPIVGLGAGGHAFFGRLGLAIGHPNGQTVSTAAIQVADFGASQKFYTGVTVPGDQIIPVYSAAQPGIAIPFAAPPAFGVRMAAMPDNAGLFPIVQLEQRYLLWGFGAGPAAMTASGRQLFINAMKFGTQQIELTLRGRTFTPEAGLDNALAAALQGTGGLHAFAQLTRIPSDADRAALAAIGVNLVNFIGDTLYVAFVTPTPDPDAAAFVDLVRWLGLILPTDKIDPKILAGEFEPWADQGDNVKLLVSFHPDVPGAAIENALNGLGIPFSAFDEHIYAVVAPKAQIQTIAAQDAVSWIEEGPAPQQITNDVARADLNVNATQQANTGVSPAFYAGLDGSGVTVAVFDTGVNTPTFTHNDFAGRLVGTANDTNGHGSHVAGTIAGSGANSVSNCPGGVCTPFQLRGMAPAARIAPFHGWNAAVWADAVNTRNAEVSNHSYIMNCGAYETTAQTIDRLVRGELTNGATAIPRHTVVWSAANQGDSAQYCTTGTVPDGPDDDTDPDPDPTTGPRGYFSILGNAKNTITVGSFIRGSKQNLRDFSSRGPTWDGRLKPEVMGIDCAISTDHDSQGYVTKCGTSMGTPSVAGVVALLTEQFHQSYPALGRPYPSTLKAVLVQTAVDMVHMPGQPGFGEFGWLDPDTGQPVIYHTGPDWSTGYGAVDALAATSYIRAGNFLEGTVTPADATDTYNVIVPAGATELKVTLAWDDEPGNPAWGVQARQLVNDLDLTLTAPDGTTVWRPWVLPALPRAALNAMNQDTGAPDPIVRATHIVTATRGVDTLNNLEQVQVPNPVAGTWTIRVNASSLPNGNPQRYSLAGDFRRLNIVDPQTGNVADAGDPANPNVFPVILEAESSLDGSPSSLAGATASQFTVSIEGTNATVVSGSPVGDQFWLMVRPAVGVYSGGSKYDLTVTWAGHGSDSETRAVLFTEREITDRAIVVDRSGSMTEFDKMAAAQNAARLFIDQSLPEDRIAVVSFSDGAAVNYGITEVPNIGPSAILDNAKAAVDGLTPSGWTAIGQGLLEGQNQVTAAPADHSLADVIILLSDGMENVDPLYDTPAVKGVIEPTDTIIHTVGVGPSSAGFFSLLDDIADDNGGDFIPVNQDGASRSDRAGEAVSGLTAIGFDVWPTLLPNRLGDVYKQFAETILDEVRLYQAQGMGVGREELPVLVPDGLKRVTFALNWSQPGSQIFFLLTDPEGNQYYDPEKPEGGICRTDPTHQTCIVENPKGGVWTVFVAPIQVSESNEWVFWASAKTGVNFDLFVGTPEHQRNAGDPVHLLAFLGEGEKAFGDGSVRVKIFGPNGFGPFELDLFDDGLHGDGSVKDGIYGNHFLDGDLPGAYAVRGVAKGNNMLGQAFEIYKNTGFNLRPRIAYLLKDDAETAVAYEAWIEQNGVGVDLIHMDSVPHVNLAKYRMFIVGPDTGYLNEWGNNDIVGNLLKFERPILGLGEGGYAFFGKIQARIGYANGAHSDGTSVQEQLSADAFWHYPYEMSMGDPKVWQLYQENSRRVDILLPRDQTGLLPFGLHDTDKRYANLIMEDEFWMLWGFQDGPKQMTTEGRRLFINAVYRTMQ